MKINIYITKFEFTVSSNEQKTIELNITGHLEICEPPSDNKSSVLYKADWKANSEDNEFTAHAQADIMCILENDEISNYDSYVKGEGAKKAVFELNNRIDSILEASGRGKIGLNRM